MKNNKKIFAGMAVTALLFGLVLAGCLTVSASGGGATYTDRYASQKETANEIKQAADEILQADSGLTVQTLVYGLEDRFPGLSLESASPTLDAIFVTYQGYRYRIVYNQLSIGSDSDEERILNTPVRRIFSVEFSPPLNR